MGQDDGVGYDESLMTLVAALAGSTHLERLSLFGCVLDRNAPGLLAAVGADQHGAAPPQRGLLPISQQCS